MTYPGATAEGAAEPVNRTETSLSSELYQIFAGSTLRAGRGKTNDIIISDRDVSRFHAIFSSSENGVVLSDLSSTNGTLVNGRRITTPVDLSSGDKIMMGNVKVAVQLHHTDDITTGDATRTALSDLQTVEVTVLLVDVISYTKFSQELPPDSVAKMLRVWFEMVGPIIAKNGGEIDKYIGDCVMALWRSAPADVAKGATAAARTAVEIVEATKILGDTAVWQFAASHPWRCRAALNSGTALFGAVGAGDRRNYTVLGDAINVAFRIEGLAGKLKTDTIMSQITADHIKDTFKLKSLGNFDLEGRIGEMGVYTIVGLV